MSDWVDIRKLLQSWPYDPNEDARLVQGERGREILQVRTPMGIEQYELDGRPDGERPHGVESALEFQLARLEDARQGGQEAEFDLSASDCSELFHEGTLYYFRYLRLFQLRDWGRTARDTARNLRVFDFVHRYARREEDQLYLEKWRPYILRIHATAMAMIELEKRSYDTASNIVNEAIEQIDLLANQEEETFQV
jgi:hypothetical protein